MLAARLPTILPDLADEEALTSTSIRSVVADVHGLLRRPASTLPTTPPPWLPWLAEGAGASPTPVW